MTARSIPTAPLAAAALLLSAACARSPQVATGAAPTATPRVVPAGAADSAAFVTRLGNDTLAIERVVRRPGRVDAEVVLRTPATSVTTYVLELSDEGELRRFESTTRNPRAADAAPRREVMERRGDSLHVTTTTPAGETQTRAVAAAATTLPFLDMIHWPYEVALMRARPAVGSQAELPLLTGRSVSAFGLERRTADSVAITHPTRGTMVARIAADGRLLGLDAAGTTRAVTVERRPWLDVEPLVARWAADDAAGRSFGALAGRGNTKATVHGANIEVDFGTPAVRGREIWGGLVPFGQVWRTGANQATHFSTDRDLLIGDLVVPAGRYTLFSIPDSMGGHLIVNRQTGQNGQQYDAARDLGRVVLERRDLSEPVEVFTIDVVESAQGGELQLRWADRALVAPIRVRAPSDERR